MKVTHARIVKDVTHCYPVLVLILRVRKRTQYEIAAYLKSLIYQAVIQQNVVILRYCAGKHACNITLFTTSHHSI